MSPWADGTPTPLEDEIWAWFIVILAVVGGVTGLGLIGLFLIAEFSR
jgi:hypothetical protein